MKRIIIFSYIFIILSGLSALETAYYRHLKWDLSGLVSGRYPIDERESRLVNCYRFTLDEKDRPVLIEYLNSGRAP
jgi:hypothetical protein